MSKKQGDIVRKHHADLRSIGLGLATDLVVRPPRLDAFWNYAPIPLLMREGGFFRSKARTKAIFGGNRSSKTSAGVFEAIMIYTGIIPPSMNGVYAREKALRDLSPGGHNHRPRHVRIIVMDYSTHWPTVIRPILIGNPQSGFSGLLPEEWSNYNEDEHLFTGPDGSMLHIYAADPAENVDPRKLRGGQFDHTLIDEINTQTVYEETLARSMAIKDGLGSVTLVYCPQEGYDCWHYETIYKSNYSPATKNRLPPEECNPAIFAEKITPMDNPSVTKEAIDDMIKSCRQWEIASRIYGEYSHRGDNPFFKNELLEQWEREGRTNNQGEFYEVEVVSDDIDEGDFEGKLVKVAQAEANAHRKREDSIIWQVWHLPEYNHKYVIPVDCSAGRADSDYNVADVWDCTDPDRPYQCAQARLKVVKGIDFAINCACMANIYGGCVLAPESNAFGEAFIDTTKNYQNLYQRTSISDRIEDKDLAKYGWNTNKYTKAAMLENLYKLIIEWFSDLDENKKSYCPVRSRHTLEELQAFEEKIKRSPYDNQLNRIWGARAGMFDDTVMTMAIAMWIGTKEHGKLTANKERREKPTGRINLHKRIDDRIKTDQQRSSFSKLRNTKFKKSNIYDLSMRSRIF